MYATALWSNIHTKLTNVHVILQIKKLTKSNFEMKEKVDNLETENSELKTKVDVLTVEIENLKMKNSDLKVKNDALKVKNDVLETENVQLKAKNKHSRKVFDYILCKVNLIVSSYVIFV